jgi:hypothetical protein
VAAAGRRADGKFTDITAQRVFEILRARATIGCLPCCWS